MPSFSRVPPRESALQSVRTLARDWRAGGRKTLTADLLSAQGVAAALALAVILTVAWDVRQHGRCRNVDLMLMFTSGVLFFDVMRFFRVMQSPTIPESSRLGVHRGCCRQPGRDGSRSREDQTTRLGAMGGEPSLNVLAPLAIALLAIDIGVAVMRPPDDAGWFVNLGAQRLRERGRLPYGDPLLTGTPGAAYGPLLYAAHVPFQVALSPEPVNAVSPARPNLTSGAPSYMPPLLATQLCTISSRRRSARAFCYRTPSRRYQGRVGPRLPLLWQPRGSGHRWARGSSGGDHFRSHIAPASMTLLAFAALGSPVVSGVLLAMSVGVGFYPAFMAPAWLGFYWNDRTKRLRFMIGFGLAAVVIAAGVYAMSRPAGERSRLGTIMYDTFGHHTDPRGYGSSTLGFWGQREGLRRVLSTPLSSVVRDSLRLRGWRLRHSSARAFSWHGAAVLLSWRSSPGRSRSARRSSSHTRRAPISRAVSAPTTRATDERLYFGAEEGLKSIVMAQVYALKYLAKAAVSAPRDLVNATSPDIARSTRRC